MKWPSGKQRWDGNLSGRTPAGPRDSVSALDGCPHRRRRQPRRLSPRPGHGLGVAPSGPASRPPGSRLPGRASRDAHHSLSGSSLRPLSSPDCSAHHPAVLPEEGTQTRAADWKLHLGSSPRAPSPGLTACPVRGGPSSSEAVCRYNQGGGAPGNSAVGCPGAASFPRGGSHWGVLCGQCPGSETEVVVSRHGQGPQGDVAGQCRDRRNRNPRQTRTPRTALAGGEGYLRSRSLETSHFLIKK